MQRRVTVLMTCLLFSCSILEETDLYTKDEMNDLVLNSVDIGEQTQSATRSSLVSRVVDSLVTGNADVHHVSWLQWSGSSFLKLRFRSGISSPDYIYIVYTTTDKPYTVGLVENDQIVELYRFRYDDNDRLNIIATVLFQPDSVMTNDTLIYDASGRIVSIERRSPDPDQMGNLVVEYFTGGQVSGQNDEVLSVMNFTYKGTRYHSGGCGYPYYCFRKELGGNTQISDPIVLIRYQSLLGKLLSFELRDMRQPQGGFSAPCCREADTFFFHPLMVLKGQFGPGGDLIPILYLIDWWKPGDATPTQNFDTDETVTFRLDYAYDTSQD